MDQQHRRLVDLLNELDEARGSDARPARHLLDQLDSHTLSHFAYEERLIHSTQLSRQEMAQLRAEHLAVIEKLADVQVEVQRIPDSLDDDMMDYLAALLSEHILGDSRETAAQLHSGDETTRSPDTDNDSDALVAALRLEAVQEWGP